jgi:hypothetical protein
LKAEKKRTVCDTVRFLYPIACVRRPNHGKAITDLVQTLGGNGGIRRFPAAVSAHLLIALQQTRQAV